MFLKMHNTCMRENLYHENYLYEILYPSVRKELKGSNSVAMGGQRK